MTPKNSKVAEYVAYNFIKSSKNLSKIVKNSYILLYIYFSNS